MEEAKVFGMRFCTYCGKTKMYYCEFKDGTVLGTCECGNTDYCTRETKEDIIKRFGDNMKTPDIDIMCFED